MTTTYEASSDDDGVPYVAKVFSASSGEKFYIKVNLSDADKGLEVVPLSVINEYLTKAEAYLRSKCGSIEVLPINDGDPSTRFPGFLGLEALVETSEQASGWWNWAERNYYDLIEAQEEYDEEADA